MTYLLVYVLTGLCATVLVSLLDTVAALRHNRYLFTEFDNLQVRTKVFMDKERGLETKAREKGVPLKESKLLNKMEQILQGMGPTSDPPWWITGVILVVPFFCWPVLLCVYAFMALHRKTIWQTVLDLIKQRRRESMSDLNKVEEALEVLEESTLKPGERS